jgi:hypothetical protein
MAHSVKLPIAATDVHAGGSLEECMAGSLNPTATEHLPSFITAPGDTDVLMVIMSVFVAVSVVMFGVFFFRLHTLPERMAHRNHKLQFEIVAVLGLIALFTHMHIFWIAGLLLALIELPDFGTALNRIAGSNEKIAGLKPGEGGTKMPPETIAGIGPAEEAAEVPPRTNGGTRPESAIAGKTTDAAGAQKELIHV